MLKKRSWPVHEQSRDKLMPDPPSSDSCFSSDAVASMAKVASFFNVPGLFVGFNVKGSSDCDSARSPTSPLEYKAFSNRSSSFSRSPRSPGLEGGHSPRSWECNKVGLSLVDSLKDEPNPNKVLGFSDSKNILFGSKMRISTPSPQSYHDRDVPLGAAPKSLPKDYGKIHSCSSDFGASSLPLSRLMYHKIKSNSEVFSPEASNTQLGSPPLDKGGKIVDNVSIGSPHCLIGSLSASEIEKSEDYTCIICHGPNPKTTHIFGDCILDSHCFQSLDHENNTADEGEGFPWIVNCTEAVPPHPSDDFLSFCFFCKKKLEEGEDIYIYRGEKAFCSSGCRLQEILIEEQMEEEVFI